MKTDDELRELLRQAMDINDNYLSILCHKDTTILRLVSEVEGLQRRVRELEFTYEMPKGAKLVSENSEDLRMLIEEHNELKETIAEQLKALQPWYVGGSVLDPMVAVNALKTIHREVHR